MNKDSVINIKNINNYLNFTYKYKNFMDSVIPSIIKELNKAYNDTHKKSKKVFTLGSDEKSDKENKVQSLFLGKYIDYNKDDKKDSHIYIGINQYDVEEYGVCWCSNINKHFFEISLSNDSIKESLKEKLKKDKLDNGYYYFTFKFELFNTPEDFVDNVVELIKANHTAFGN